MERLGWRYYRSFTSKRHLPLIWSNLKTPLKAFSEPTELGLHEVKLILVLAAEFDFWDLNDGATSGIIITVFSSLNCEIIFAGAF